MLERINTEEFRQKVVSSVLERLTEPKVEDLLARRASKNKPSEDEVREILEGFMLKHDASFYQIYAQMQSQGLKKLFDLVKHEYSEGFLEKLVELRNNGKPTVFFANHCSFNDTFIDNEFFYKNGMWLPQTLAGSNLNVGKMGETLRKISVWFLDRPKDGKELLTKALYYITAGEYFLGCVKEGMDQLVYPEKGRGDDGSVKQTKSLVINELVAQGTECYAVTVSHSYRRVPEDEYLASRRMGEVEQNSQVVELAAKIKELSGNLGDEDNVYVVLSDPVPFQEYVEKAKIELGDGAREADLGAKVSSLILRDIAKRRVIVPEYIAAYCVSQNPCLFNMMSIATKTIDTIRNKSIVIKDEGSDALGVLREGVSKLIGRGILYERQDCLVPTSDKARVMIEFYANPVREALQ